MQDSEGKRPVKDVPKGPASPGIVYIRSPSLRQRIGRILSGDRKVITEDQLVTFEQTPGFPWTYPRLNQRPIGTLFAATIDDLLLQDMYRRYQLARRIVDAPVEESFYQGFQFIPDPRLEEQAQLDMHRRAMRLYKLNQFRIMRFAKLVRLYGHSELLFGWNDPKTKWVQPPNFKDPKSTWGYTQPIPKPNEQELKESDTIPVRIEYLSIVFGSEAISNIHPSRFIHAMNPKLIEEDKEGESVLLPIANMLNVQIHADWSIGQNLWRSAGGLLALGGKKGTPTDAEITAALSSVENHNAKTVIYIPFGWTLKNIQKGSTVAIARTYKVVVEQIAAGSGIPVSILLGSQRGALAPPEEDKIVYYRTVGGVQETLLTPSLMKFFRVGQLGGHIPPGSFEIVWNPLEYQSKVDKAREALQLEAIRTARERITEFKTGDLAKLITKKGKRG
jgi:hypothetical protein